MSRKTDALTRAIEYLDAVEVAPERYAFQIARGDEYPWYVATREQAQIMCERYQALEGGGFYDRVSWVKEQGVLKMPRWWTPERRFAVMSGSERRAWPTRSEALYHASEFRYSGIITADLETGEEIPA